MHFALSDEESTMAFEWSGISHITKIDPAKPLPADLGVLEHTDLVIVGGSDNVTEANTLEVIRQVAELFPTVPLLQEPSSSQEVSVETISIADCLLVPAIYNGDHDHFVGKHLRMFTQFSSDLVELIGQDVLLSDIANKICAVGYVIQNTDAKAAQVTGVTEPFSVEEVQGAALATEIFYDFPLFYIEYSGQFGETADVYAAAIALDETRLLYGGGIDSAQKATQVLDAGADAVVVGDCFHEDSKAYLKTTQVQ